MTMYFNLYYTYNVSGGVSVKSSLHNGRVEQHIHFWLGEEASTDEVMKTSVDLFIFMWD